MLKWVQSILNYCDKSDELDPNDVIISLYAIMIEIAKADKNFSEEEAKKIDQLICRFNAGQDIDLPNVRQKTEILLKNNVDLYDFTKSIRQNCSVEQRVQILSLFWQLVYTDGYLDPYEEQLMKRLCDLIGLQNSHYIECRRKVLEDG